jgi:hypothetical protein
VSGSYAVKTSDGVYVGDLPVADGGVVPRAFYDFVIELQPDIAVVEFWRVREYAQNDLRRKSGRRNMGWRGKRQTQR